MSDQADLLVSQIRHAHEEFKKSQTGSVWSAFEAGERLIELRETWGHGNFDKLCKKHFKEIPQTTRNLYMRFAKYKQENSNAVADLAAKGELTVRGLEKLLPKRPQTPAQKAAAERRQADKRPSTIEDMLADLDPDELFTAVRKEWELQKVGALANLIYKYLKSKAPPAPSDQQQATST
jgi:hypothetical protein